MVTFFFALCAHSFAVVFFFMYRSYQQSKTLPRVMHRSGQTAELRRLDASKRHHIFLSHCWSSAQDQMRVIKQLLKEVLPGVRVFLDVDDLDNIARLEEEIRASLSVLIFVSRGYFESKNCLREFATALQLERGGEQRASVPAWRQLDQPSTQLIFVCESERGKGMLTEAQACAELDRSRRNGERKWRKHQEAVAQAKRLAKSEGHDDEDDVPLPEFEGWPLPHKGGGEDDAAYAEIRALVQERMQSAQCIQWYRGKAFQQISLLQIAERLVLPRAGFSSDSVWIPGGPLEEKVPLPTAPSADGFHLYVSPNNAGALDFAYNELRHVFDGHLEIAYSLAALREQIELMERLSDADGDPDAFYAGEAAGGQFSPHALRRSVIGLRQRGSTASSSPARHSMSPTRRFSSPARRSSGASPARRSSGASPARGSSHRGSRTSVVSHTSIMDALHLRHRHRSGRCVFLLYLDGRTWTSPQSEALAREVEAQLQAARASGCAPAILMLHERDVHTFAYRPVDFASFFETTPPELIKQGLYQALALPLLEGNHRRRSLREAAEQLVRQFEEASHMHDAEARWSVDAVDAAAGEAGADFGVRHSDEGGVAWCQQPASAPMAADALTAAVALAGAAHSELPSDEVRGCLNYDRIEGIDDDTAALTLSPVLHFELRGAMGRRPQSAPASGLGAFRSSDEGRHLTIVQSESGRSRKVYIDGVERKVKWQRKVERNSEERERIVREKGLKKFERFEWREWRPGNLTIAEIVKVEEEVGGVVRVLRESLTVGHDGLRSMINYQFDNPPMESSRLALLGEGLGEDIFAGKSRSERKGAQTSDKLGDALTDANITCAVPDVVGHKSEFARRELVALPGSISMPMTKEIRALRYLWRGRQQSTPGGAANPSSPDRGGSASHAPVLDLEIRSPQALREEARELRRGSCQMRRQRTTNFADVHFGAAALSSAGAANDDDDGGAICFSYRPPTSSGSELHSPEPTRHRPLDRSTSRPAVPRRVTLAGQKDSLHEFAERHSGVAQEEQGWASPAMPTSSTATSRLQMRRATFAAFSSVEGDETGPPELCRRDSSREEAANEGESVEGPGRMAHRSKRAAEQERIGCIDFMARRRSSDHAAGQPKDGPPRKGRGAHSELEA